MSRITALASTMLSLIGLYLVLVNFAGASRILTAVSSGTVQIFRTLQGR